MTPASLFTAGLLLQMVTVSLQGISARAVTTTVQEYREAIVGESVVFSCDREEGESGEIGWCLRDSDGNNVDLNGISSITMPKMNRSVMKLFTSSLQKGNYSILCFLGSIENKSSSATSFLAVLPQPPTTSTVLSPELPSSMQLSPSTKSSPAMKTSGTIALFTIITTTASTTSDISKEVVPVTDDIIMQTIVLGTSLLCVILFLLIVFVISLICLWYVRQSNSTSSDMDLTKEEEEKARQKKKMEMVSKVQEAHKMEEHRKAKLLSSTKL